MNEHASQIVARAPGRVLGASSASADARVVLCYVSSDPYAVTLTVATTSQSPVVWMLARDLLADGLHCPVGLGDVAASPCSSNGSDVLRVTLRNGRNAATVELRAADVMNFLRKTYSLVPSGSESGYIDLDTELFQLLAD